MATIHIAIQESGDGKLVDWLEKVGGAEYSKDGEEMGVLFQIGDRE